MEKLWTNHPVLLVFIPRSARNHGRVILRADKFSALEDNIRAASQTVMITTQSGKPAPKGSSELKNSQNKGLKRPNGQSEKHKEPP